MPGRTDNRCRRRWFTLMRNDPKVEHVAFLEISSKSAVIRSEVECNRLTETGYQEVDQFSIKSIHQHLFIFPLQRQ